MKLFSLPWRRKPQPTLFPRVAPTDFAKSVRDWDAAVLTALPGKDNLVFRELLAERMADCLLALAEDVGHIRKSETACTVACPACRLRWVIQEALR